MAGSKMVMDRDGNLMHVPDDFNHSDYGAVDAPPPSGGSHMVYDGNNLSPAQPPPPPGPGPGLPQGPDPYQFIKQNRAPGNGVEQDIAGQSRLIYQGGHAAQAAVDPHYQAMQRSGHQDVTPELGREQESADAQRDAAWLQGGAQLQANDAHVQALQQREHQLDQMRLQQQAKQNAITQQAQRDRNEYEGLKNAYQRDVNQGATPMGTLPGALATIGGMLAIGLAAKGKRENLESTIAAVQGAMNTQVDAMRANTAAKGQAANNAYSRFLQSYGNQEQAEAATKALLNDQMATELERTAAQSQDPVIQANAAARVAALQNESARYQNEVQRVGEGNVVERFDPGHAAIKATGGGYRLMTDKEWTDYQNRHLGVAEKLAGLQKTGAETNKLNTETQTAKADAQSAALDKGKDVFKESDPMRNTNYVINRVLNQANSVPKDQAWGTLTPEDLTWSKSGDLRMKANAQNAQQHAQFERIKAVAYAYAQQTGMKRGEALDGILKHLIGDGSKAAFEQGLRDLRDDNIGQININDARASRESVAEHNQRLNEMGGEQAEQPGEALSGVK